MIDPAEVMPSAEEIDRLRSAMKGAYIYNPDGFTLASGRISTEFMDAKRGVSTGENLVVAGRIIVARLIPETRARSLKEPNHVAGLVTGATPAMLALCAAAGSMSEQANWSWTQVSSEADMHTSEGISHYAGAVPGAEHATIMADDVTSTAGSFMTAWQHLANTGVSVVGGAVFVDRSEGKAAEFFEEEFGAPFVSAFTIDELREG